MTMRPTGRPIPRSHRVSGFTLIETIVVLTILGLALTIVIGFVPRRPAAPGIVDVATHMAEGMRMARARAIAENRAVVFAVLADGRGYRIDNTVFVVTPPVSATGPALILFAPDGSASGGTVRVASGAEAKLVQVNWLTGRVTTMDAPR